MGRKKVRDGRNLRRLHQDDDWEPERKLMMTRKKTPMMTRKKTPMKSGMATRSSSRLGMTPEPSQSRHWEPRDKVTGANKHTPKTNQLMMATKQPIVAMKRLRIETEPPKSVTKWVTETKSVTNLPIVAVNKLRIKAKQPIAVARQPMAVTNKSPAMTNQPMVAMNRLVMETPKPVTMTNTPVVALNPGINPNHVMTHTSMAAVKQEPGLPPTQCLLSNSMDKSAQSAVIQARDTAADSSQPSKAMALRALPTLEALGLSKEELRRVLERFIGAGVSVAEIKAVRGGDAFRLMVLELLLTRYENMESSHRCFNCGNKQNLVK